MTAKNALVPGDQDLFDEISSLIESSRQKVVFQANASLTLLFWQVGKRINDEILDHKRAEYGQQILPTLSAKLESRYGRNFTEKNIRRMVKFSQTFPASKGRNYSSNPPP